MVAGLRRDVRATGYGISDPYLDLHLHTEVEVGNGWPGSVNNELHEFVADSHHTRAVYYSHHWWQK